MRWFIAATVVSLALVPLRGVRSRADEPGTADGKEPVVVATWEHQVAGKSATIKLYSNGRINDPAGKNTWAQKGNTLTLRWPNPKAPGGAWVDTCKISADGKTFAGHNQNGTASAGRLVSKASTPGAVASQPKEPGGKAAERVQEIAVWWGNGKPVDALAVSPDGSRLAITRKIWKAGAEQKGATASGEAVVWDVAGEKPICTCNNLKTEFTSAWFSADGKTLVTVANGVLHRDGGVKLPAGNGIQRDGAYQVWDVQTGREIGAPIVPAGIGMFSTVAISPDGKYLATVYYEQVTGAKSQPIKAFKAHEILVWDVAEHKVKWKLPGVPHTGRVTWGDDLAFSPDGTRLALLMSGGGPEARYLPIPGPRGQPKSLKPLRMLTLEAGKYEPTVALLPDPNTKFGALRWPTSGKFLVLHSGRTVELVDSNTGKSQGMPFHLRYPPPPPPPPPPPNSKLLPLPPANNLLPGGEPRDYFEPQWALSADGSRLATHFAHDRQDRLGRENRVVIWDVPSQRPLGVVALANEPPALFGRNPKYPAGYGSYTNYTALRIDLSGNGHRLAVSDMTGTVRVYDVSRLSGTAVPQSAGPPPEAERAAIRDRYERAVADAHQRLLEEFDEVVDRVGKFDSPLKAAEVARLKELRDRFDKHNELPWSSFMVRETTGYLHRLEEARAQATTKYGRGPVPDDLRELMDRRVIARWKHEPGGATITLYSNGRINDPRGLNLWTFGWAPVDLSKSASNPFRANLDTLYAGRLQLRWKNAKAPGGYSVDTCAVDFDGLNYDGNNQNGAKVSGKLIRDELDRPGRDDSKPANRVEAGVGSDVFTAKSVWVNDAKQATFTVLERDGQRFRARFQIGDNTDREIVGEVKGDKVSWLAKNVRAARGNRGGDNTGTFGKDGDGPKIDFTWRSDAGGSGTFTLRLRPEK